MRTKEFDPDQALNAAMCVFWQKGFEATSIQDLVAATGVNRASLYQSFGSKRGLFQRALERFSAGDQDIVKASAAFAPGLPRIRAALRMAGEQAAADVRGCMIINAVVEQGVLDSEMQSLGEAARQHMQDFFVASLAEAERLGEIRPGRDRVAVARFLTNAVFGLRVTAKTQPDADVIREIVETTLSFIEER